MESSIKMEVVMQKAGAFAIENSMEQSVTPARRQMLIVYLGSVMMVSTGKGISDRH